MLEGTKGLTGKPSGRLKDLIFYPCRGENPRSHPKDVIYPSIRNFEYSELDLEEIDRLEFCLETPEGIQETSEGKRILPENRQSFFSDTFTS